MPPDARELVVGLVGTRIYTLNRGKPNDVLGIQGANVLVGTETSPAGKLVSLRLIQNGLDQLFAESRIRISVEALGHRRTSFVGAILGTLPGVEITASPVWVELASNDSHEALDGTFGYPDPAIVVEVDRAGVAVALNEVKRRYPDDEIEEMPHNHPGFDIRVRDSDGVTRAYIEVKSTSSPHPVFYLSENERVFATNHHDRYHLLVVTSVDTEAVAGNVTWRSGAFDGEDVQLQPRQWRGRLLPG